MSGTVFVVLLALALFGLIALCRWIADRLEAWQYERSDPDRKHCGYHEALDRIREAFGYAPGIASDTIATDAIAVIRFIGRNPAPAGLLRHAIEETLKERARFLRSAVRSERQHVENEQAEGSEPGLIAAAEHFVRIRVAELENAERVLEDFRAWCKVQPAAVDSERSPAEVAGA